MSFDRVLTYAVGGVAAVIAVALLISLAPPSRTGPDRDAAAHMIERVNEARADEGLGALQHAPDIAEVAEEWSAEMAADRDMRHNPSYAEQICCWETATENVAWSEPHRLWRPGDPVLRITDELHQALLDSPGHRANLLDANVDEIGIGVHVDEDGNVWITQNFRRSIRE